MTLNGVIAFILRYFTEFDADYVTVVEYRPIMSAKYRFPVTFGQNWPMARSIARSLCDTYRVLFCVVLGSNALIQAHKTGTLANPLQNTLESNKVSTKCICNNLLFDFDG